MLARNEQYLRALLLDTLKPIARILLESNIQAREANDTLKAALVFAASEMPTEKGRTTNVSQISRATGLTRRDVTRLLRKYGEENSPDKLQIPHGGNLLTRWHTDSRFLNRNGEPKSLQFSGDEDSFVTLAEKCMPEIDAMMVLDDLLATGAVKKTGNDEYVPTRRNMSHSDGIDGAIAALRLGLHGLAHTVEHNLRASKHDTWIQRTAFTSNLDVEKLAYIRKISRDRAVDFCFGIDDLLSAASSDESTLDKKTVGVGVYYYELDN